MKYCNTCKKFKESSEFNKNRTKKDGLSSVCRNCDNKSSMEWYIKNRDRASRHRKIKYLERKAAGYYEKNKDRREYFRKRRREVLKAEWKKVIKSKFGALECERCGFDESYCALDLHHIDPTKKTMNFGKAYDYKVTPEKIAELDNCRLLCKNCHQMLHHDMDRFNELGELQGVGQDI